MNDLPSLARRAAAPSPAGAAFAQHAEKCEPIPKEEWKPQADLERKLTDQGWKISRVKITNGCYEVYGHDAKNDNGRDVLPSEDLRGRDRAEVDRRRARAGDGAGASGDRAGPRSRLHWSLVVAVALGWATTSWLGGWHRAGRLRGAGDRRRARRLGLRRAAARALRALRARPARHRALRAPRAARPRAAPRRPQPARRLDGGRAAGLRRRPRASPAGSTRTDRFWGDETVERCIVGLAWALVALASVHVAGVVVAAYRHRENLVAAMLDGRKRAPRDGDID